MHLMQLATGNWQRCVFNRCESCGKRRDPTVRYLGEWRPCFVERYPRAGAQKPVLHRAR